MRESDLALNTVIFYSYLDSFKKLTSGELDNDQEVQDLLTFMKEEIPEVEESSRFANGFKMYIAGIETGLKLAEGLHEKEQ